MNDELRLGEGLISGLCSSHFRNQSYLIIFLVPLPLATNDLYHPFLILDTLLTCFYSDSSLGLIPYHLSRPLISCGLHTVSPIQIYDTVYVLKHTGIL